MKIRIKNQVIGDIDLIIFDRDGTLIDLYAYWSWMIAKRAELVCEKLHLNSSQRKELINHMGVDEKKHILKPEGPVGIKPRETVMQSGIDYAESLGHHDCRPVFLEAFKQTDELSVAHLSEIIKPIKGLLGLFDTIIVHKGKIAIATTDKTERAQLSINHLELTKKVACVIGADRVKQSKPAPDMVFNILKNLNIEAQRTVMVGDAITDIQMGKNAGLKASIGVCTGITPLKELAAATPFIINDISEIKIES